MPRAVVSSIPETKPTVDDLRLLFDLLQIIDELVDAFVQFILRLLVLDALAFFIGDFTEQHHVVPLGVGSDHSDVSLDSLLGQIDILEMIAGEKSFLHVDRLQSTNQTQLRQVEQADEVPW